MATHLTLLQKKEILERKDRFPGITHKELKEYFDKKFKLTIGLRTIGGILKKKKEIMDIVDDTLAGTKKVVLPANPGLEKALELWCDAQEAINNPISEDMIRTQAQCFSEKMGIENYKMTNGTLSRFKKRAGLKCRSVQGEMGSVTIDNFENDVETIKQLIAKYDPRDVYNMDETGLYYRLMPLKSTSKNPIKGCKKLLTRITLAFEVSLIGEKLQPFMIGTAKNPHPFRNFNVKDFVDYGSSKKAWMNSTLYKEWVSKLNRKMMLSNRKILLLVDNCPSHSVLQFDNVRIVFLPPNSTGLIQPLDLGIIRSFKCNFRKELTHKIISSINSGKTPLQAYKTISIKDAAIFSYLAWQKVTPQTIVNCWRKSPLIASKSDNNDKKN